jgi:hypothetical protein
MEVAPRLGTKQSYPQQIVAIELVEAIHKGG